MKIRSLAIILVTAFIIPNQLFSKNVSNVRCEVYPFSDTLKKSNQENTGNEAPPFRKETAPKALNLKEIFSMMV